VGVGSVNPADDAKLVELHNKNNKLWVDFGLWPAHAAGMENSHV
jgi:hypothetical protein